MLLDGNGYVREESGKDSYDIKWTSEQATTGNEQVRVQNLPIGQTEKPQASTGNNRLSMVSGI